ncbi:glycosyltransferase [Halomonas sp. TD01]|uniref:glycosyltransferase family protein n=1 Tax=Halomonas sp. TD01 TaxID=999141 RepID=UPI000214DE7D|nr:glycosyltransferase [Halomonas sp. TD01]EGP21228.1 hypothetical protein GME_02755 [Halomonas sp. TD01]CAH1043985.1 hypothetical protein HPTD01_2463 [Halomonas sp. TD01]
MDDLLKHAQQLAHQASTPIIHSIEGRVAFLINQAPGSTNGSHRLAEALNQQGVDTLCMIRPDWTGDDNAEGESYIPPETTIDGVRYLYSPLHQNAQGDERATLEAVVQQLIKLLRIYRPSAVLAETAGVGLPAWVAAARLEIAFYGVAERASHCDDVENGKSSNSHYPTNPEGVASKTFVEERALKLYGVDRVQEIYKALNTYGDNQGVVSTAAIKTCHESYNVLTLLDEASERCFKHVFNFIPADALSWEQQLDQQSIDIVFVGSVLPNRNSAWHYGKKDINGAIAAPFKALLLACKEKRIPTVFWNKDDPVNYDMFIDAAKLFDYVFTVDESVINRYKQDVGHGRVYFLKLAVQEALYFPQLQGEKNGRLAFSDSWSSKDTPVRADHLEMLFDYPAEKGILDIYGGHSLPGKYKQSIFPSASLDDINEKIYKKYSVMVNANTAGCSSPLLVEKFYESLGCAVPIVSPPVSSLDHELADIVQVVNSRQEAQDKIDSLLEDDIYALKVAAQGVRLVHSKNTFRHRFAELLSKVVESKSISLLNDETLTVTAVCVSKRPWLIPRVAEMLNTQNGVNVKVIYVAHGEGADEKDVLDAFEGVESCRFMRITGEDKVLADGLNLALDSCETDVIAKIDDDDYYGPNYLLDACLALQYSGAALVGKTSFFCYVESTNDFALRFSGKHYRYFKHVQGGTLIWSRKKTGNLTFNRVRQGTDSLFLKDLLAKGCEIYSSDPFNFIHVRYANAHDHTWAISDDKFLEAAKKLDKGLQFSLAFN